MLSLELKRICQVGFASLYRSILLALLTAIMSHLHFYLHQ